MARSYNLKNIRTFFRMGFSEEEIRRLCFYEPEFRPVFEKLSQGMGKDRVIDVLIEYAERRELIEYLLDVAKKLNPAAYERYQPYDDEVIVGPTSSSRAHRRCHRVQRRTEHLGLTLSAREKSAALRLAEIEGGLSLSALVRRLIRKAAIERKAWPSLLIEDYQENSQEEFIDDNNGA